MSFTNHALLEYLGGFPGLGFVRIGRLLSLASDTYSHEDDRRCLCHESVKLEQRCKLVVIPVNVDVKLLYAFNGEFVVRQGQYICFWCECLGILNDMWGKGSREEHSLNVAV
jgi:hypothetical protein